MSESQDERLLPIFEKLVGLLHEIWIEMEACAKLAQQHGATYGEVEGAKREALADLGAQAEARKQFADMWETLKNAGLVLENADLFGSLPPTDRPN